MARKSTAKALAAAAAEANKAIDAGEAHDIVALEKKAMADAIINQDAETALALAPIDHDTQIGSWHGEAQAAELVEVVDALLVEGIDKSVLTDVKFPLAEISTNTHTAEEVSAVVAVLEAQADEALTEPVQDLPADDQVKDFDTVIAELDPEKVDEVVLAIDAAFTERVDFESRKDPDNGNIHRTLKKARTQMVTRRAASVLLACNVSPTIINRSIHEGACYNVYALGKLADAIVGLTGGFVSNAINKACSRSLFSFRNKGLVFTGEMARAAASDKIRVSGAVKDALIRYTVAASTAPTQASSTMQALETLGIVVRTGGHKNPTFTLTAHPAVAKLERAMALAA